MTGVAVTASAVEETAPSSAHAPGVAGDPAQKDANPLANGKKPKVKGADVSSHQGPNINWKSVRKGGVRFVYIKATEGTTHKEKHFTAQRKGAGKAGLLHGAYHFALPKNSSGTAQAKWFVSQGGDWSPNKKILPPTLDMEQHPGVAYCYGLSKKKMIDWVQDFSDTVRKKTGRRPMIYTTTSWWRTCTGNTSHFAKNHPLWIARYASKPGKLPKGWNYETMWQFARGVVNADLNSFNGSMKQLNRFADKADKTN